MGAWPSGPTTVLYHIRHFDSRRGSLDFLGGDHERVPTLGRATGHEDFVLLNFLRFLVYDLGFYSATKLQTHRCISRWLQFFELQHHAK